MTKGIVIGMVITIFLFLIGFKTADYIKMKNFHKVQKKYPKIEKKLYDRVIIECKKNKIYEKIKMVNKPKDIGPRVIFGIINAESNWSRYIRGASGEYSYMQIMPYHLPKQYQKTPEILFDIDMQIIIGVKVFSICLDKKDGDIISAINYYNKGKSKDVNIIYLSKIMKSINMEF